MSSDPPLPPDPAATRLPPSGAAAPTPHDTVAIAPGAMPEDRGPSPESHLSLIGRQFGPYRIQAELGAGGMGAVYLAEQLQPVRRQVALKVIKAGMDSGELLARFQAERELLARMTHPNIAQVLDVGATPEGRLYFAMEYVPGVPVNDFCDRRGLSIAQRLELFLQVCDGVQHAHQKGVIHRDLKPGNLMVADYQGRTLAKVIDFGIAKSMDARGGADTGSTRMGVPIGTPAYMSPEQAAGDLAAIDTRTDVYSLGVVLYRLITHDLPISGDTLSLAADRDLARVLREAAIRPPSRKVLELAKDAQVTQDDLKRTMGGSAQALARTLKGDLDWITLKALERERELRYASVSELAADLRRYLRGEAVLAGPPSKLYRIRKFVARNKLAVGAAAAVLLSLILGIIGTSYMAVEARRQRLLAEAAQHRAEAESARAIATRDFLEGMIAAPDPWKLMGSSPETRNVRVVDALQAAAADLDARLAGNPALRGDIATMLGRTLRRLGQLDASRKLLESAVAALRTAGSANGNALLPAELQLAITLAELGESPAADAMLGRLLPSLGEAADVPEDAVAEARRAAAMAAAGVGDAQRAVALARENLAFAERQSGSGTATSGAKAALAELLGEKGEWAEAERLLIEAYTSEQLRLGREHPVVMQLLSLMANLAYRKGDYKLAEQRYREAAQLAERALGASHPETIRIKGYAVLALADGGAAAQALPEYREQIAALTAAIGPDHPDVLQMRSSYANALLAAGELDAAESEMEDVYRRRRALLGEIHPDTLSAINLLGVMAHRRGDYAKAELLYRRCFELYLKAKGADHPETVMIQTNYLAVVRDLKRTDEAIAGLHELLPHAERILGDHWHLALIRSHLALALMEQDRYDEAEPLLESAYALIREQLGDDDARTQLFKSRLADLYTRQGKAKRAAMYR